MTPWQGKRTIAVVTACMTRHGMPHLAHKCVAVTFEEYENGSHYAQTEIDLLCQGYEEPFCHFDEFEAPEFLHPAVREHLKIADSPVIIAQPDQETLACPGSSK